MNVSYLPSKAIFQSSHEWIYFTQSVFSLIRLINNFGNKTEESQSLITLNLFKQLEIYYSFHSARYSSLSIN